MSGNVRKCPEMSGELVFCPASSEEGNPEGFFMSFSWGRHPDAQPGPAKKAIALAACETSLHYNHRYVMTW